MARRVQFGTTWWGKQWIDALTHLDYENRLPRGRTYYNTGRIDDMQFNPAKLRVEAIAHGSAYSPYEVAIDPGVPLAAPLDFGLENLVRITSAHLPKEVFRG